MSDELVMVDELLNLGEESAHDARAYLATVNEVASGSSPDTAIPVLLLAVSQILVAGARLGAITDVVPDERFEADPGPDADVDPVRQGLAGLFERPGRVRPRRRPAASVPRWPLARCPAILPTWLPR